MNKKQQMVWVKKYPDDSIGYATNNTANKEYKEMGLACEWEHCIELQPVSSSGKRGCPVFGHNCPGGVLTVKTCKVTSDDFVERLK